MTTAKAEQLKPQLQHLTFINEMATHGQQRRAYMAAYPGCTPEAADRGAHRLMERREILAAIETGREEISIARQQMLEASIAAQLMDVQEKRGVLKQIYKGEMQNTIYNREGVVIKRTEDVGQRMQAMRLDDKLLKDELSLLRQLAEVPALAAPLCMQSSGAAPAPDGYNEQMFDELPDFFSEEETYAGEQPGDENTRKTGYNRTSAGMNTGEITQAPADIKTNDPDQNVSSAPDTAIKDKGWKNSGLYAALPPEERAELDQIRQRYMAAKAATDKVLYGSIETEKAA